MEKIVAKDIWIMMHQIENGSKLSSTAFQQMENELVLTEFLFRAAGRPNEKYKIKIVAENLTPSHR